MEQTYSRPTYAGVCVADGFGVRVVVERGALEVHDGIGPHRRTRRFDRATHGLRRLVVANAAGTVSLDALRWCDSLGVGVLVLDGAGTALLASTPRQTDDARLRRAQALAPSEPYGVAIARELLHAKLTGQARNVVRYFSDDETAVSILALAEALDAGPSVDLPVSSDELARLSIEHLRQIEASAAALYFGAWSGRPECAPGFAAKDRKRIPAHWQIYEGRRRVLHSSNANRKAERPVNALLNYCFALLEAEAVLACQAVGLDPGLGIVHNDARGRASMALDLIEPVRPEVEAFVLDLLANRTFRKGEFTETPDGHVRLLAPLTHELAEHMAEWARSLAPWAEKVAHTLGAVMAGKYVAVAPLTRERHKAAQAIVKARKAHAQRMSASTVARQRPGREPAPLPLGCVDCGQVVSSPRHVRCADCIASDPAQAPEVRSRRGAAISARKRALRARGDAGLPPECDTAWYRSAVLPALRYRKLAEIMETAGCSKASASDYRAGRHVPHVSTWAALAELARADLPGPALVS
jgi:CRISPR-associated endonuclease Cas1